MEVHERFMKLPTTGVNVLETLAENRDKESQIIRELVEAYNKKISDNVLHLETLETFRMILCHRYKSLIHDGGEARKCQERCFTDLRTFFMKNNEYRKTEEFSVLYDIVVLQLVLSDDETLRLAFKDFWDSEGLLSSPETVDLAMRVSECFADSHNLRNYVYKSRYNSAELEEDATRILSIILLWMKRKEGLEWKLLASLLPKLTVTFEPRKIISPLWQHSLGSLRISPPFSGRESSEITDLEEKLTVLCVMADVCFPSEKERVEEFHYEQCLQDEFWCILNRGLVSKNFQPRKQALYLIKRALEFVETHKSELKKKLKPLEKKAMPFLCTKTENQGSSLEEVKRNFFLILEVLEEKQKHLVLPALSHLPSLANVQADHESCCDYFNPIWLRCVYRRIVQHDNDSVKIFGLQEILKSDPHIFCDDEFLLFFVEALNDTHLYEYNDEEEKPRIAKELEGSFLRWEQKKMTLINSFVRALSSISWGPVAIYWIVQALLAATERCKIMSNVWGDGELHCVEDLIQKSLMMHNVDLRSFSHLLIIRTFTAYTSMPASPSNLNCIFNILCSFPDNRSSEIGSEWIKIAEHLSRIIRPSDAVQYVTQRCKKMFTDNQDPKSLARAIHLLVDAELILVEKSCPAEKALRDLFENLVGADVRPYADKDVILRVIEFLGHLMSPNVLPKTASIVEPEVLSRTKIDALIAPYIDAIFKIARKSLEGKTISRYNEYLFAITALSKTPRGVALSEGGEELYHIENKCVVVITDPHNYCRTQWCYAVKMLLICRQGQAMRSWKFGMAFVRPLLEYFRNEMIGNGQEGNVEQQNAGPRVKSSSDWPATIAQLLNHFFMISSSKLSSLNVNWIGNLQALVETENEHVIGPVANILGIVLSYNAPVARHDLDTIIYIIRMSWRITFQLKDTTLAVENVCALTTLITSQAFLQLEGSEEYAFECVDQIIQEAERVPAFKPILLEPNCNLPIICAHKVFMSCLLHGAVLRRDQRIERAALLNGYQFCSGTQSSFSDTNMDIRKSAIYFIPYMADKPEVQDIILKNLLEFLDQNKNKRYFDNSHLHRLKQRVMQALLVQESVLEERQRQCLYDTLCDLLIAESNQPSVRLMHEWLLIRLCSKNAEMRETMWKLFDTAAEKRPGSIVSLASVVFHVARLLSKEMQREYIVKAIPRFLPNCMGQQFNVRLYSQAILVKLYEMLPRDCAEAEAYEGIFKSVEESLRRGNLMKNSSRVLDDFYFTLFDPILDYNLQTIYYDLPRLTNVSADEFTPAIKFVRTFYYPEGGICLEFAEPRDLLSTAKPSAKSSKPTGEIEASTDASIDGGLSDVQKKIIPWKTMVPFYDDLSEMSKARLSRRKTQNEEAGIIVVASLIDRPPNLGGIARSCEIFGAQELVIGSLRYAEDREFQTLSVSAEKWITITEVKPHLLKNYLLEKQSKGWKLVGAEQTANSVNLLETVFPKKTILLLGNEKDGIPANLIPLMDTCVEIPQSGVVRSLNVHVTGAICIWQYAKQHIFT